MNITDLLDRPIAYHRVFVTLTGSVKAAILLSQALYWQKRAKQADGWWYKTSEEWQEETGLSRHEQDTARSACEKYLKTDLRDAPARLYWKVDEEALTADLFAENGQSSLTKSGKLDSRNSSTINKNAETTTETTTPGASAPKPDILDGMIALNQKPMTIRKAVTEYFPFNVNWETKYAREWLEWAHGENITPEQIKQASETWRSDKQFNWQVPTLKLVFEKWPALMKTKRGGVQPVQLSPEEKSRLIQQAAEMMGGA